MSHSFGEGYATRSDEEGFGGIYGGNQSLPKTETDKFIHENHPGLLAYQTWLPFFFFNLCDCLVGFVGVEMNIMWSKYDFCFFWDVR